VTGFSRIGEGVGDAVANGRAMPPSQEGETRAAYVIQRHFRRVRKGYDPAEVDRHLQLVSEWFRTSRAAEKTRELGELSATSLASRGCAGAVLDGGARDAEYILHEDFPVFSRYVTPQDSVVRWELMAHGDVTIVVGGVRVSPGDWIVGDRDGLVIIPGDRVEEIRRRSHNAAISELRPPPARQDRLRAGAGAESASPAETVGRAGLSWRACVCVSRCPRGECRAWGGAPGRA
jgi:DivIVA domain-containing protein